MRLENHCMLWIPLWWQLLGTGIHIHTWCFCLFFLSASSFCCFSNFSVALASRNPWRLVRLYAFTFIAVSRDVSLRVHDKIWSREVFFLQLIQVSSSYNRYRSSNKLGKKNSPHFWVVSENSELWELWVLSELVHEDLLIWWWVGYLAVQCAQQYGLQLCNAKNKAKVMTLHYMAL